MGWRLPSGNGRHRYGRSDDESLLATLRRSGPEVRTPKKNHMLARFQPGNQARLVEIPDLLIGSREMSQVQGV